MVITYSFRHLFLMLFSSCLLFNASTYAQSDFNFKTRDAAFIKLPSENEQSRDLVNLISSAAAWAVSTNKIRNGSGIKTGISSQDLKSEGQLTQSLNVLSFYDLYLSHGVLGLSNRYKTQAVAVFTKGSWDDAYLQQTVPLEFNLLEKSSGLDVLFSKITASFVKAFSAEDIIIEDRGGLYKKSVMKENLYETLENRFQSNISKVSEQNSDSDSRLTAMGLLSQPFSVSGEILVNPYNRESFASTRIYMPLVGKLIMPQQDDPRGWYYQRGFTESLPKPISTRFAVIEKISLHAGEEGREARSKTTVAELITQKEFSQVNQMAVQVNLGHLSKAQTSTNMVDIDSENPEESLIADGYLHMRDLDNIEELQGFLFRFKVRAYMQSLAFNLIREPSDSFAVAFTKDAPFKPQFDVLKSRISYRLSLDLKSGVNEWFLKQFLETTGFNCERDQCTRFFKTSQELEDSFFAKLEGKIISSITDNAFQEQLPKMQADGDKAIGDVFITILSDFEEKRSQLKQVISNLK